MSVGGDILRIFLLTSTEPLLILYSESHICHVSLLPILEPLKDITRLMKQVVWLTWASRCLPLATLTQPGSLSIVTAPYTHTTWTLVETLDFTEIFWNTYGSALGLDYLKERALRTASDMIIPTLISSPFNSSYSLQFYGPTLQCLDPSGTQQATFDYYNAQIWNQSSIASQSVIPWPVTTNVSQGNLNVFLASMPAVCNMELRPPNVSLLLYYASVPEAQYVAASTSFPSVSVFVPNVPGLPPADPFIDGLQLWVQTAKISAVSTLVNASFELDFSYTNDVQTVYTKQVEVLNVVDPRYFDPPGTYNNSGLLFQSFSPAVVEYFSICADILQGKLTVNGAEVGGNSFAEQTGLPAGEELSSWDDPKNQILVLRR